MNRKKFAKKIEEVKKMHTRELLHCYGSLNAHRGSLMYRAEFGSIQDLDQELGLYQEELYRRIERIEPRDMMHLFVEPVFNGLTQNDND